MAESFSTEDVVIVVPCFNEAAVIAQSVARLRAWFPAASVLVSTMAVPTIRRRGRAPRPR